METRDSHMNIFTGAPCTYRIVWVLQGRCFCDLWRKQWAVRGSCKLYTFVLTDDSTQEAGKRNYILSIKFCGVEP